MQKQIDHKNVASDNKACLIGSVLMGLLMPLSVCLVSACSDEVGPEPSPELEYLLVNGEVFIGSEAGEVTVAPFAYPEGADRPFVPMVFIKESYPLSEYNCELFVNRQEDIGSRLQGLDVKYYCEKNGMPESLDSPDVSIPYKWVEVSTFTDTDKKQQLVVRYEENTDPVAREMYVHFYDGQWGVVRIQQKGHQRAM